MTQADYKLKLEKVVVLVILTLMTGAPAMEESVDSLTTSSPPGINSNH